MQKQRENVKYFNNMYRLGETISYKNYFNLYL